jgi:hypothetical protein
MHECTRVSLICCVQTVPPVIKEIIQHDDATLLENNKTVGTVGCAVLDIHGELCAGMCVCVRVCACACVRVRVCVETYSN